MLFRSQAAGTRSIPLSRRITLADGSFGGVVVLFLDPDYLLNFYRNVDVGTTGLIEVVGLDGISRVRRAGTAQDAGEGLSSDELLRAGVAGTNGHLETGTASGGTARFVSYRTLHEYPMMVAVGVARDEILQPLARDANGYYLVAALVSALAAAFAKLLIGALHNDRESIEALARSEIGRAHV